MVFVVDNQPPEVIKPGKRTLYLQSTSIASEFPAVLNFLFFLAFTMLGNHFNNALVKEPVVLFIAVVSLVSNQLVRRIFDKTSVNRIIDKLSLVWPSAFHMGGDRNTCRVSDCLDLGDFFTLCLAYSKTLFLAGTKPPSMNTSRISILSCSLRSSTSSMAMRLRSHCWKRRWHVGYGRYLWGNSFHDASVRIIHSIPLRTSRGSLAGRPLVSFTGVEALIMGYNHSHCSFVNSILIVLHIQDVMNVFNFNYFVLLKSRFVL
ncbi:hypothetical protein [Desulfosarcina widdelii]|uniref:hypothetical protein n=1 Tax=Desulfosarcina widdelii TaxID=947919 RepID=UPI001E51EB12|nr:hypothetical protein [Desulfosarcina widdelii]